MKLSKGVLVAVGVLVFAAAALMMIDSGGGKKSDPRIGEMVFSGDRLIDVTSFTINSANSKVTVTKSENGAWQLSDGFPADASKINNLFESLRKTKPQRVAASSENEFTSLEISDESYLQLTFSADKNRKLLLGKNRQGGGQFAAFSGEDKAYLLSEALNLNSDISGWELKTLLDIEPKKVKSVAFVVDGKRFSANREKAEDEMTLQGSYKKKVKDYQIKSMENVLQSVNFMKRHDLSNELAKTAIAKARHATVSLFDGRVYSIKLGKIKQKDQDRYFVHIEKTKPGEDVSADEKAADELLTSVMKQSAFEVTAAVYKKFAKTDEDIFEKKVSQKAKTDKKG
jgi:hypothetical protein